MKCLNLSASYAAMQELNPSLTFDQSTGQSKNAEPTDPVYFQNLGQYYINNALARGAIAPQWEVDTSRLQDANGVGNAGLSEVERDANAGQLSAGNPAGATTETWNPIGIDLGGGLATRSLASSSITFNVDGTADSYYEFSSWSRPYLLGCSTKTVLKMASNEDFERVWA